MVNISVENIPIVLFEFIVFNTHTCNTTRKSRQICCCSTKPELTLLEHLVAWDLRVEWEHLFQTTFKWFRRKNNLGGLRTTHKGKQRNNLILPEIALSRFTLDNFTLDNFSLSSQQLVQNYFLYPSKSSDVHLREILAQFWPNKHSSTTRRHLAMVETHPKSWKRQTAENYLRSIVMLLTLNQLHFSWSYWLPKFLLLPYTCDGYPQKLDHWII